MNQCQFIGRLAADPESKKMANGNTVARFRIAMSKKWTDANGQQQEQTAWATCIAFDRVADTAVKYCRKGNRVGVVAAYEPREYEHNGQKNIAHEFKVGAITIIDYPAAVEQPQPAQAPVAQPVKPSAQRPILNDFDDAELPF